MPFAFTCPRCGKNNYGLRGRPGNSIVKDRTCLHCKLTPIAWVERGNEQLAMDQGFRSELLAVGVDVSDREWFDPTGGLPVPQRLAELLEPHASVEGSFNQATRRRELIPEDEQSEAGLCEGLCLHWIRRVVLGGESTFKVKLAKRGCDRPEEVILARMRRQMSTAAKVQRTPPPASVPVNRGAREAAAASATMDSLEAGLGDLKQMLAALNEGPYPPDHWSEYARNLDQSALERERGSKRRFSGLVAVSSVPRRGIDENEFVGAVCATDILKPGTALMLSFGIEGRDPHSIAVYAEREKGSFLFFDPNIGVYRCDGREKLKKALDALVYRVWRRAYKWETDGDAGYTVFAQRDSPADVRPREHPITDTPDARTTAFQNVHAIPAAAAAVLRPPSPPRMTAAAAAAATPRPLSPPRKNL